MEFSVKKEQVQWRSHCRSFGELGMLALAASGRRQASRFRWPNLMIAVPLQMAPNVGPQCQSIIPVARVLIICVMLRLFRVMSQGFLLVLDALMKMQGSQARSSF